VSLTNRPLRIYINDGDYALTLQAAQVKPFRSLRARVNLKMAVHNPVYSRVRFR